MIIASIVLFNNNENDIVNVIRCVDQSIIEKLFIIDNSKTNNLKVLVEGLSTKLEYVQGHGNIGFGAAHNIAIKKAFALKADYHIVINPDVKFSKNVIVELENYMNNNSCAGLVTPKVYLPNGELQYICRTLPSPVDIALSRVNLASLFDNNHKKNLLSFTNYDKIMNVPFICGCFLFFRISALQDIGLFDERFFMYAEDIDIVRRMHSKYKTIFLPSVSIVHAHEAASKKNFKMFMTHTFSLIKYFNKWGWFFDCKRKYYNNKLIDSLK